MIAKFEVTSMVTICSLPGTTASGETFKGVGATLIYLAWFCYNVSLLEQQQYTEQERLGCQHKPVSEGACQGLLSLPCVTETALSGRAVIVRSVTHEHSILACCPHSDRWGSSGHTALGFCSVLSSQLRQFLLKKSFWNDCCRGVKWLWKLSLDTL